MNSGSLNRVTNSGARAMGLDKSAVSGVQTGTPIYLAHEGLYNTDQYAFQAIFRLEIID